MGSAFWKKERGDCESVEPRLEEYMSGALPDGEEKGRIETHLAACAHCRTQAAVYQRAGQAWDAFSSLPSPERPGDWNAVRSRLQAPTPQRSHRPLLPILSGRGILGIAVAMTAGVCAVLYPAPKPVTSAGYSVSSAPPATRPAWGVSSAQWQEDAPKKGVGGRTLGLIGAAPAFEQYNTSEVNPIVITVVNKGDAVDAEATVVPYNGTNSGRAYLKKFRVLPGESRLMLYPSLGQVENGNSRSFFQVTLTAPHFHQDVTITPVSAGQDYTSAAYIGARMGAMSPNYDKLYAKLPREQRNPARTSNWNTSAVYGRPENAPDRAIGYNGFTMVVLSQDAVTLNPAQWQAVREWTQAGGQLILVGGDGDPLLNIPQVAEIAPITVSRKGVSGTTQTPKPNAVVTNDYLRLDKGSVPPEGMSEPATVTRRQLGLGVVYYTDFDPTAEPLREWAGYGKMWERFRTNRSFATSGLQVREAAHNIAPWNHQSDVLSADPFKLALPSLPNVVYMFLIYFVLVVPVTFVVLKHTRRMNLAWVTGPCLAVLFSAGLFLLTARLYLTPTSRRTSGILALTPGENEGRFVGYTEMFFPRAGSYEISVPRAESLELNAVKTDRQRSLDTREEADGRLTIPAMSVGNLAFRRLYQEQKVTLTGGVTANLRLDAQGRLTGTLYNDTGLELRDASVRWSKSVRRPLYADRFYLKPVTYELGTLKPGVNRVNATNSARAGEDVNNAPAFLQWQYADSGAAGGYMDTGVVLRKPTLVARIGGAAFGPQLGKDFSGDRSVIVLVGLDGEQIGGQK